MSYFSRGAKIFLGGIRPPAYGPAFTQPALSYLMFNLPLTKSSQQLKTARHCRACVVTVHKRRLDVCIFARFKVNCELVPLLSFAVFKLIVSRHRKELRGALGHGLCVNPSLAVTENSF